MHYPFVVKDISGGSTFIRAQEFDSDIDISGNRLDLPKALQDPAKQVEREQEKRGCISGP